MKYHKKLMEIFLLFAGLSNDNVGWKLGGQLTLKKTFLKLFYFSSNQKNFLLETN